MLSMTKIFRFACSHHLPNHPGKCKNDHGHSMQLEVTIYAVGGPNMTTGMIMDFGDLKKIVNENVIDKLDHNCLNNIMNLPTAENMTLWILSQIEKQLPYHIKVKRIRLWEEMGSACVQWEA